VTGGTGRLPAAGEPQLAGSCVEVPGGRLWTEQAGAGPAVLFAHAGIADARMWDEQITALAGRYHAIRYDQRGHGRSSPPDVPYSPAADLGAVLDHAGADQAVLVGCSVGGAIAINYALAHPGRVTGLVLAAASTSGLPPAAAGQAPVEVSRPVDDPASRYCRPQDRGCPVADLAQLLRGPQASVPAAGPAEHRGVQSVGAGIAA